METPTRDRPIAKLLEFWAARSMVVIAGVALAGIALHLILRFGARCEPSAYQIPLWIVLGFGGVPLVFGLLTKLAKLQFGSDLLAGISIVTAVVLGEYLAGALVVLMLSGGEAVEGYAVRSASSVLRALARRMPALAHRRRDGQMADVALSDVAVGTPTRFPTSSTTLLAPGTSSSATSSQLVLLSLVCRQGPPVERPQIEPKYGK